MSIRVLSFLLFIGTIISCNNTEIPTADTFDYRSLKKERNLNIDSLYRIAALRADDTVKVIQLLTTYKLSIRNRPIRLDILEYALKISKQIKYNTGIALSLNYKGLSFRYNNEYLKSIKYHKEAVEYFENSWDVLSRIKNLNSLGVSYRRMNIEEEAIKCYFKALKLSEKEEHTKSVAISLNGIGNSYINLKKYDDAIRYFKLAISIEKSNNNLRGIGYDYSNIGEVYMYKEMYDSSFVYHMKSLKIANKIKYKDNEAIIYNTLGQMFQHKKEYYSSIEYFNKAIPILRKYNSQRYLSNSLINIGISQTNIKLFKEGKTNILEGLEIAKSIASKENIVLGYGALSNIYKKTDNYKLALDEHLAMSTYRDSIFNIQSENNIMAIEIKYESEKKDEQIKRLNLESKVQKSKIVIQFLAIIILAGIAIFSFIFYRMRMKNKELEIKDMRYKIEEYISKLSPIDDKDNDVVSIATIKEYGLSTREEEVLSHIAQGLKNQEIADMMFVSLSTVKTHTKNIFEKLDVRNRIEAAKKAQAL